jgi:hypothetical protein
MLVGVAARLLHTLIGLALPLLLSCCFRRSFAVSRFTDESTELLIVMGAVLSAFFLFRTEAHTPKQPGPLDDLHPPPPVVYGWAHK